MSHWPLMARRVFVDSSAFFAIAAVSEANHTQARAIRTRLIAERWRLFTTNFVVAETHALVLTRANRVLALRVLEDIENGFIVVVRVSARDERRAREIIYQYEDKDFSLTDATNFAVMERLCIGRAFTFDSDFAQYGIPVMEP